MPNGIDLGPTALRNRGRVTTASEHRLNTQVVGDIVRALRSCYKLVELACRQLPARSRLVSSAYSKASYCLKYWETRLGKTTLNSNDIIVAKKNRCCGV